MSQRVLGVGWGVFSLAFLWTLLFIAVILLHRIRALVCLLLTVLASVLTTILLVLPREEEGSKSYTTVGNVSDSMTLEPVRRFDSSEYSKTQVLGFK